MQQAKCKEPESGWLTLLQNEAPFPLGRRPGLRTVNGFLSFRNCHRAPWLCKGGLCCVTKQQLLKDPVPQYAHEKPVSEDELVKVQDT